MRVSVVATGLALEMTEQSEEHEEQQDDNSRNAELEGLFDAGGVDFIKDVVEEGHDDADVEHQLDDAERVLDEAHLNEAPLDEHQEHLDEGQEVQAKVALADQLIVVSLQQHVSVRKHREDSPAEDEACDCSDEDVAVDLLQKINHLSNQALNQKS